LPAAVYEDLREQEGHFLVSNGHEDQERVIREDETYRIVVLAGEQERSSSGGRSLRLEAETVLSEPS
jgi:hypothetical protein